MKKVILGLSILAISITSYADNFTAKKSCSLDKTSNACELSITKAEVKMQNGNNTAVKMHIKNTGDKTVDIVAAYSPIDAKTQLHHFITNSKGNRVMKQIKTIEIYPHNTVDLSYQELHVMLIGLKEKLTKGQKVPVMLILEDGSTISTVATVE